MGRSRFRRVALPSEHGSWAFVLSPLVIGIAAGGRWTLPTTYLVVAALCAFLVRTPITVALQAARGRRARGDLPAALAWIGIYATVGALHVLGLVLRGHAVVLWLALPGLPVFLWHLALVGRRQERRQMLVELVGAGVLAFAAPAAVFVERGAYDATGWAAYAVSWGHGAFGIVLAYLRLEQRTWRSAPPPAARLAAGRRPLLVASGELVAAAGLVLAGALPRGLLPAFLVQLAAAFEGALRPAVGWMPRRIGMRLLLGTVLFTALAALGWWL